jgi:hypothetical protein
VTMVPRTTYATASGSLYEVTADRRVRQVRVEKLSSTNRIGAAWRTFHRLDWGGVGTSLTFTWEPGAATSDVFTHTSPVVEYWEGPE